MSDVVIIGTVATSFYGFRADLIRTLLKKGHKVYAFTSEYTAEDLKKIEKLGATPITYTLNRGGLNRLVDMIARYQLSKEVKAINLNVVISYLSNLSSMAHSLSKWLRWPKNLL